jgi:hypothetical protein
VQLQLDPLFDAELANAVEIAGAGAEGQTVDRMPDAIVRRKTGVEMPGGAVARRSRSDRD